MIPSKLLSTHTAFQFTVLSSDCRVQNTYGRLLLLHTEEKSHSQGDRERLGFGTSIFEFLDAALARKPTSGREIRGHHRRNPLGHT